MQDLAMNCFVKRTLPRKGWRFWTPLLLLAMVWCIWLAAYRTPQDGSSSSPTPQYSFLASLHCYLLKHADQGHHEPPPAPPASAEEIDRLDRSMESLAVPPLNVYVYEMPARFTTDLLWLFQNSLAETANLTSNGSPVHRLIEQHSVDFWLFSHLMAPADQQLLKTVRRVRDQAQADVFYIPFFTTIPFFLLSRPQSRLLYREAVKWITGQAAWQRSGGRDHVLAVHHPWSMKSHRRFLKSAIWLLPDLDSSGNWYKEGEVSLEKDVILPYVTNVEACDAHCLMTSAPLRKTLLFFRGRTVRNAGGKVRSKLAAVLQEEGEGVVIQEGSSGRDGKAAAQHGMRRSVFCLSPAGDTPSSARLFDAIVSGCIPVVVSDELELPFEGILDYRQLSPKAMWQMVLFVAAAQAVQKGWLVAHLRSKSAREIATMQLRLAQCVKHFQYGTPAQPAGPEDLAWRMVAGKLQSIRLHIRRSQRRVWGAPNVCSCHCTRTNSTAILL